jgi:outer membrane lipoprotein-sorting protein
MKKWIIFLIMFCALLFVGNLSAAELQYHKVYKPKDGMTAEEIMQIAYYVQYTKFASDVELTGYVYLIDKSGFTRERTFLRQRIVLGRPSDDIAYKDLVMFTGPTAVKGLATLTWSYMDPDKGQNQWLWLPSLKKIRKISAAQSDDSFMGSDFTIEEITTRRLDDETYSLLRQDTFRGYQAEFNNKTYKQGTDCFVIEAKPKASPWYYSKRVVWIDKNTGGDIYHEIYDPKGRIYKTIFKNYEIMNVNGKEYAPQTILEVKDLRSAHKTVIEMKDIKFDQGLSEDLFTEKSLLRSRW